MPEPEPKGEVVGSTTAVLDAFGHGLRVSRDFAAGEVVLEERPRFVMVYGAHVDAQLLASVCEVSGLTADADMARTIGGALELWIHSDTAARTELLELFGTPDDPQGVGEFVLTLARDIQALHTPLAGSDPEDLAHAVLIWLLSAHTTAQGMAVFTIGHRCNHSCSPNVVFQNTNDDLSDGLVFRALRSLDAGEMLSVSYLLGPELMSPGFVRRELLTKRKCFECACTRCVEEKSSGSVMAAEAQKLRDHPELVAAALAGTLELSTLNRSTWAGHWIFMTALWAEAIHRLRSSDTQLIHSSVPLLDEYFAWVGKRHSSNLHFASAQAMECYACISSAVDEVISAAVARLCAPYMRVLEYEYGAGDAQNTQMRAWLLTRCGQCGKRATSRCARCKDVSYCGAECQKMAWKTHKRACSAQVVTVAPAADA